MTDNEFMNQAELLLGRLEAVCDQLNDQADLDIDNQRLAAFCIEPRSVLAQWTNDRLVIRMSTQMPTGIRTMVCDLLGLATDRVQVVVGDVAALLPTQACFAALVQYPGSTGTVRSWSAQARFWDAVTTSRSAEAIPLRMPKSWLCVKRRRPWVITDCPAAICM